jgi:sulfur carrier protein
MEILVNNKPEQMMQGNMLSELLLQLGLSEKKGIAVAVNNRVVGRADWAKHSLQENDKVTIIRPTQGG